MTHLTDGLATDGRLVPAFEWPDGACAASGRWTNLVESGQ